MRDTTTASLVGCYDDLEALIGSLGPGDWGIRSLCPEWTVRGVVEHLTAVESVLAGWRPTDADNVPPFDGVGEFLTRAESWSHDELTAETAAVLSQRRADLAAATDELFAQSSMTPVGPGTYGQFMDIRVFDFWVHHRDMTGPLGRATDDGGPAAEIALDEVHDSIGYIVGKKVGLPDGMSVAFHLTGPVERSIYAAVDGRAAKVDHVEDPTVEVTTDSLTFVQLACGRIDPQEAIDADRISWRGDPEWGERIARNLRFTM